jgi:CRISPR-associated protein Csd1
VILQALNNYYERLKVFEERVVPPLGYTWRPISFALIIDPNGRLVQVQDLREQSNKRVVPKQMMVPSLGRKKSSGVDPDFLWGSTGYVLGAEDGNNPDRTKAKFIKFKEFQHQLGDEVTDEGLVAVLSFLDAWNPDDANKIPVWSEMKGLNVVFRLDGKRGYIHESPLIREMWAKYYLQDDIGGLN